MRCFSSQAASGLALLAAATVAAAFPAGAAAYHAPAPGSFFPEQVAPVFPGSSPAVQKDGWKLTGRYRATQSLIAPQWALATAHAQAVETWGYNSPLTDGTGNQAIIKKVFRPTQEFAANPGDDSRPNFTDPGGVKSADVTLVLLDRPMPAPADGFPRLLSDRMTPDLATSLPGYVLWTGQGSTLVTGPENDRFVHPESGWTRPNGLPVGTNPPLATLDGDSGSVGLWYPSASSRPVISAVTATGTYDPYFGRNSAFSAKLSPSSSESYATLADWIKAKVASVRAQDPAVSAPEWTTLTGLGVNVNALTPPAPREIYVGSATASTLRVNWSRPVDTRVPMTGYKVSISPAVTAPKTVGAATLSTSFTGLRVGQTYTVTVRALNGALESRQSGLDLSHSAGPGSEPESVSYAIRPVPPTPAISQIATRPQVDAAGEVSYCVKARVDYGSYTPLPGTTRQYEFAIDGQNVEVSADQLDGNVLVREVCSGRPVPIAPSTTYGISARSLSGSTSGSFVLDHAVTPAGVPAGTIIDGPKNVVFTARRSAADGAADYCIDVRWGRPAAADGFPHRATIVHWAASTGGGNSPDLDPSETTYTACGLNPATRYMVSVQADRTYGRIPETQFVTTPTGAPQGTLLPPPIRSIIPIVSRRTATSSDFCIVSSWAAPSAVAGFPVDGYVAQVWTAGFQTIGQVFLNPATRATQICGIPAGGTFWLIVGARYQAGTAGEGISPFSWTFKTPAI